MVTESVAGLCEELAEARLEKGVARMAMMNSIRLHNTLCKNTESSEPF